MADSEGWIEWRGIGIPVESDVPLEYEHRDGQRNVSMAGRLDWEHFNFDGDIVRYRVLVPQVQRDELLAALEAGRKLIELISPFEGDVTRQMDKAIANVKGGAA